MLFVVKWGSCVWICLWHLRCVCVETQWVFWVYLGFLGFSGLSGFKWVYLLWTCQFKAFCVYVRMGIREEKCKTPLILPFLGSYLSFRL